jgi:biotin carboxyl carrier protein
MIYIVNINDKVYEVEVEKGKANLVKTTQAIVPVPSAGIIKTETNNTASQASVTSDNITGESVKSPMPGTILDIKVNVGAKVKKGQLLLILEAMKMENEIFAPVDGTVSQITVSKGSTVSTNDILMAIQ